MVHKNKKGDPTMTKRKLQKLLAESKEKIKKGFEKIDEEEKAGGN